MAAHPNGVLAEPAPSETGRSAAPAPAQPRAVAIKRRHIRYPPAHPYRPRSPLPHRRRRPGQHPLVEVAELSRSNPIGVALTCPKNELRETFGQSAGNCVVVAVRVVDVEVVGLQAAKRVVGRGRDVGGAEAGASGEREHLGADDEVGTVAT